MSGLTGALIDFFGHFVTAFAEYADRPLTTFFDITADYYILYVLSALIIALAVHLVLLPRGGDILRDTFSLKVWWSPSSRADYRFHIVNNILFPIVVVPILFSQAVVADAVSGSLGFVIGFGHDGFGLPDWFWRAAFTLAIFIAYDLGRFIAHWGMHMVPILWQFHKVHHSAEVLTPITTSRGHPVDFVLMWLGGILGVGIITGVFMALAGSSITFYAFLGANALLLVFRFVALLRHTHVWLTYGPLERFFVSPAMHQVHHSALPEHRNANCGFILAVWDRWAGTWIPAAKVGAFPMGLGDGTDGQWHSVWRMYVWPVRDAWRMARGWFRPASPVDVS